jgi:ATP-dependent Clp protease ATP-binding subunit ClpC
MNRVELTPKCHDVLKNSKKVAESFNHTFVTSEHVFLSILDKSKTVRRCVKAVVPEYDLLRKSIIRGLSSIKSQSDKPNSGFSPRITRVITLAGVEAKKFKDPTISVCHLTLGLLTEPEGLIQSVLEDHDINVNTIKTEIYITIDPDVDVSDVDDTIYDSSNILTADIISDDKYIKPTSGKTGRDSLLNKYSVNITDLAKNNKLDPIIGRDNDIQLLIQVLLRRKKNNPVIIGDSGVGKTALVEGLAQNVICGKVPERLAGCNIYSIDLGLIIAGTKYRGQFEERLKGVLNELKNEKKAIGFIDELHTVSGSGNSEGSLDVCNMLKPALASGEITVIGTTTLDEYRIYIESDAALTRRFEPLYIKEPTSDDTIQILQGIKHKFEQFHNVRYRNDTINEIVRLTDRYISDSFFPDKAINVLDELGANIRSKFYVNDAFNTDLELKIDECEREKLRYIADGNTEEAAATRLLQGKYQKEYENEFKDYERKKSAKTTITPVHVEQLISKKTEIPVERIDDGGFKMLKLMESNLNASVLGQEEALLSVCQSIKRSRTGLCDEDRPISSFLFLGTTGVGKTHLAKCLSENLFGDRDKIVQIDMSEYMEGHSISKLIGSPPGYIGHEQGGNLTEHIRRNPYSIILFDEVEKAHPDILHIMLQLLEEGRITDSLGNEVNFKNCVIILTSNVGANRIQSNNTVGFGVEPDDYDFIKSKVLDEVKKAFTPEFLNRIDDIIIFRELEKKHLIKIVNGLLADVKDKARQKGIRLTFSADIKQFLIEKGYDKKNGARPLKRAITKYLETPLADFIIDNNIISKSRVKGYINDDSIVFEILPSNLTKKCTSDSA